jgi:hypothetical protein
MKNFSLLDYRCQSVAVHNTYLKGTKKINKMANIGRTSMHLATDPA